MDNISFYIGQLRYLKKDHTELGNEILCADNKNIYPLDLLAIPVLNRSLALLSGFCDLIEKKNFLSAAPLIRLQLDNLLRFQAGWLVDNPHDFAIKVLAGEQIRNLKDREGNKMTDTYLVKKISKDHPSFKNVYNETSGFIHLSNKHMFSNLSLSKNDTSFTMTISAIDTSVSDKDYIAAMKAFFEITGVLFQYLKGWALTKDGKNK